MFSQTGKLHAEPFFQCGVDGVDDTADVYCSDRGAKFAKWIMGRRSFERFGNYSVYSYNDLYQETLNVADDRWGDDVVGWGYQVINATDELKEQKLQEAQKGSGYNCLLGGSLFEIGRAGEVTFKAKIFAYYRQMDGWRNMLQEGGMGFRLEFFANGKLIQSVPMAPGAYTANPNPDPTYGYTDYVISANGRNDNSLSNFATITGSFISNGPMDRISVGICHFNPYHTEFWVKDTEVSIVYD